MHEKRDISFWILIIIGSLLALLLLFGQTMSLVDYDLTVSLGLQESVEEITEVGVSWNKSFAFGDTLWYLPIVILGIVGLLKRKSWGLFSMFGAMAITVYWPIVSLYMLVYEAKDVLNLNPEKYTTYSIILPLFTIYGLWGIWYIYKNRERLVE